MRLGAFDGVLGWWSCVAGFRYYQVFVIVLVHIFPKLFVDGSFCVFPDVLSVARLMDITLSPSRMRVSFPGE